MNSQISLPSFIMYLPIAFLIYPLDTKLPCIWRITYISKQYKQTKWIYIKKCAGRILYSTIECTRFAQRLYQSTAPIESFLPIRRRNIYASWRNAQQNEHILLLNMTCKQFYLNSFFVLIVYCYEDLIVYIQTSRFRQNFENYETNKMCVIKY